MPATAEATASERVRLVVDVSESLDRELERLAVATGSSKANVIRCGFALVKVAIDEKARGNLICILDRNHRVIAEITGI